MHHIYMFTQGAARAFLYLFFIGIVLSGDLSTEAQAATNVDVWWPTNGVTLTGTHPLKALVSGKDIAEYSMYWQVDGGSEKALSTSYTDYPHKEVSVDFSSWNWKGKGPYTLTFIARDHNGNEVGRKDTMIYTNGIAPNPIVVVPPPVQTSIPEKPIEIWWPAHNAELSGTLPFKALLTQSTVESYTMYWQVDGGVKHVLPTNYTDWPHKESLVDVNSWAANAANAYTLTFTAQSQRGEVLGSRTITVRRKPVQTQTGDVSIVPSSSNPLQGKTLYTGATSSLETTIAEWRNVRPGDAKELEKLRNGGDSLWIGNWNHDVEATTRAYVTKANQSNAVPILVAYNIPGRDCGSYSAGGAHSAEAYKVWITSVARGIGSHNAVVIVEPDAVPGLDCLSSVDQELRLQLLQSAVDILKKNSNTIVYIDAGNAHWKSASDTAIRLKKAGIGKADGFSLNVSNFYTISENEVFGTAVSALLGGAHYVIDTSRNGNGSNGEWCNPWGRGVGSKATTRTEKNTVDAYLWIKKPGESDGTCNGGPAAGTWWPEYALDLAKNSR